VRSRETFHAVTKSFGGVDSVLWGEDPRIREQDFGNFQDPEDLLRQKKERERFGRFYYRYSDGESVADVYDRVSSFFETLYRHWENHPDIETYVIVAHGVAISAMLMRLFKYPVDDFCKYRNFENCEFAVLEKNESTNRLEFRYCVRGFEHGAVERGERNLRAASIMTKREMRFD
jgi:broad specificity phosphatase PhoE